MQISMMRFVMLRIYVKKNVEFSWRFGVKVSLAFVLLYYWIYYNRRDSSSGRASASCAVGQVRCRIDTWPRHTKDVIKMVPVATLLGAQHYKASTGFSSLSQTMQH